MSRDPIRSLFEKQMQKQNVSNLIPTKAAKAELLNLEGHQSVVDFQSEAINRNQLSHSDYIILDEDGYVVNVDDNKRNQNTNYITLDDHLSNSQQTDYIVLDENGFILNNGKK